VPRAETRGPEAARQNRWTLETIRRVALALLWQIYSRRCSLQILFGNADIAAVVVER
jgi:hypothetical protein